MRLPSRSGAPSKLRAGICANAANVGQKRSPPSSRNTNTHTPQVELTLGGPVAPGHRRPLSFRLEPLPPAGATSWETELRVSGFGWPAVQPAVHLPVKVGWGTEDAGVQGVEKTACWESAGNSAGTCSSYSCACGRSSAAGDLP